MNVLRVIDVVGTKICVAVEDGHLLHEELYRRLEKKENVQISFDGVRRLTTAFLNSGIGQLYNEFDEETIRSHLSVAPDTEPQKAGLIKKATDRAKQFYQQQKSI
ncbi:STAS-like domain-containing protein [Thalassospira lucentensis]|uniref:STAS-like domain-containing protein n=1 Tax=Thalassospira lucentensis TaxID=168935 RepID=UPI003AA806C4